LHSATVVGGIAIILVHAIIFSLLTHPGWSMLANAFWTWLR
jgi:hypothetical protein